MEDFGAWRRALELRQGVQFKSYPTLNHLFIAGSWPSSPAECNRPGHVDGSFVADIAAWIQQGARLERR